MRDRMMSAAAVALVLLVAGCGSAAGTPAARGSGGGGLAGLSLSLGDTSGSLILPLNAYSPTTQQIADMQTEQRAVTQRCMQKEGFSVPTIIMQPMTWGPDPGRGEFYNFGVTSMAFASVHGYHDTGLVVPPMPALPGLTRGTAEGVAYGQCSAAARKESGFTPLLPYLTDYQDMGLSAWQQALTSPVVVAGFKRWSVCMATQGYDYANPIQAELGEPGDSQAGSQWNVSTTAGPSQLEIQTAEADVRCKESTGLLKQWIVAVAERQARVVQLNLPLLQADYAKFGKALVRLQEMAASS